MSCLIPAICISNEFFVLIVNREKKRSDLWTETMLLQWIHWMMLYFKLDLLTASQEGLVLVNVGGNWSSEKENLRNLRKSSEKCCEGPLGAGGGGIFKSLSENLSFLRPETCLLEPWICFWMDESGVLRESLSLHKNVVSDTFLISKCIAVVHSFWSTQFQFLLFNLNNNNKQRTQNKTKNRTHFCLASISNPRA